MPEKVNPMVVVGIDGSPDGLIALDWAVDLAGRRQWAVRGVHVLDYDHPVDRLNPADPVDDGTSVLEEAADELSRLDFSDATFEVRTGHPAQVLLDASRDAALLVIGRRGAGGFAELVMGSTSQVCTALAESSLVVVPDSWKPNLGQRGLVVVGVDASADCQQAIGFAFEYASEHQAELVVLHVPRPAAVYPRPDLWLDPDDAPWQPAARRLVTEALTGWPEKYPDVVFRTHYRPGHPVQVLAAHSSAADLVVVGGGGRSEFTPLRLGSVSRGLIHHSLCPVAIIHSGVSV